MRFVLLLLVALTGVSCSKPVPDNLAQVKQQVKEGQHDPKQYSRLNEQMVYNHRFAEIFGLDPASAIKLDPGVLAIRIYWTVFANKDFTLLLLEPHERWEHMASMRIQLFLEDNVPVQLLGEEGTLYNYESFVRSGFLYFQHPPLHLPESFNKADYREFYYRVILGSEREDGAMSSTINRYKRTLVPGVTAIDFEGGLYKAPFFIYLYIGDKPASPEIEAPQIRKIAVSIDDYDPELFVRVKVPDELAPVLTQPFREQ